MKGGEGGRGVLISSSRLKKERVLIIALGLPGIIPNREMVQVRAARLGAVQ